MTITEDAIRFNKKTEQAPAARRRVQPLAAPLETSLRAAADKMRAARLSPAPSRFGASIDFEELAARLIEEALRDQHAFVLCSAEDPANPTPQEHRWAQSMAGAVASRFQRTARKMLRSLKNAAPAAPAKDTRSTDDCPVWCLGHGTAAARTCDWHESKPVSFEGPSDMFDDNPEPYEVLWAALSETPQDEIDEGATPGAYIFFDTLADGGGSRLNVDETDALIRSLTRYTERLQGLRNQLAAINGQA